MYVQQFKVVLGVFFDKCCLTVLFFSKHARSLKDYQHGLQKVKIIGLYEAAVNVVLWLFEMVVA